MNNYRFLLAFLLVGVPFCTTVNFSDFFNKFQDVDSRLAPYLDDYTNTLLAKNKKLKSLPKLTAGFAKLDGTVVGVCTEFLGGNKEIEIDRQFWKNSQEQERIALIFHEAAHCLCNRKHDHRHGKYKKVESFDTLYKMNSDDLKANGYFFDRCPASLMHPEIPASFCLHAHWEEYMEEIFERCSP